MPRERETKLKCPYCDNVKGAIDTIRKHMMIKHRFWRNWRMMIKRYKARLRKRALNQAAYGTRKERLSGQSAATKATVKAAKVTAKKSPAKRSQGKPAASFEPSQEPDVIMLPIVG